MTRILACAAVALFAFILGLALVRLLSPARVVVIWETASEVGTDGFFLYRSESPDGPFSPLDGTPVLATGDPLAGAAYRYQDLAVDWGRRYFYQLEEIEAGGDRNRYPKVVEGRAGLGWTWALVIGAGLALLAACLCWLIGPPRKSEGHRAKQALLSLLLLFLLLAPAPAARASVDLLSFEATAQEGAILVTWETASEIDVLGFYLQRAPQESGDYQRITGLIPTGDDPLVGGSYDYLDTDVVAGSTYYYRLEAVELGGASEYHGPVSATVPAAPTDTPPPTFPPTATPTFTFTPTPTHTPSPTPTATNIPSVTPTPSPTASGTPSMPTATSTPTPRPTLPTSTPRPSATPTGTASPSPTSTPTPTTAASLTPTASPSPAATAAPSDSPPPQPSPTLTPTPPPPPTFAPPVIEQPSETAPAPEPDAASAESPAQAERLRNWVLIGVLGIILAGLAAVAFSLGIYALYRWRRLR